MRKHIITIIVTGAVLGLTSGCICTAPVSLAWRSHATQQYATTEGETESHGEGAAVNADKTNDLSLATKPKPQQSPQPKSLQTKKESPK